MWCWHLECLPAKPEVRLVRVLTLQFCRIKTIYKTSVAFYTWESFADKLILCVYSSIDYFLKVKRPKLNFKQRFFKVEGFLSNNRLILFLTVKMFIKIKNNCFVFLLHLGVKLLFRFCLAYMSSLKIKIKLKQIPKSYK